MHTVAFEILEKCNLYCDFCVRNASTALRGVVSLERFRERTRTVLDAFPRLELLALTGGEPFLYPNLLDLVSHAAEVAPRVSITTNGTVHRSDVLAELARAPNVHFIVSIDGPDPATHDRIRGRPGALTSTLGFVESCRRLGLPVLVNMTVNERNSGTVYETARLARRIGAADISVALVKPEGRGRAVEDEQVVLADVGRQFMAARAALDGDDFVVRFTDPLSHLFAPGRARSGHVGGCGAGSGSLHVQCDGTVLLCTSCKESLGNIDDPALSLRDAAARDGRLRAIGERTSLGGACGGCELNKTCGGCRCRASATAAGFLGGDPLCPRNHAAGGEASAPFPLVRGPDWGAPAVVARWKRHGAVDGDLAGTKWLLLGPERRLDAVLRAMGADVVCREPAALRGSHDEPASYDYVACSELSPGPDEALKAILRLTRDGGRLLLTLATSLDDFADGSGAAPWASPGRYTVLQALRDAGFADTRIIEFDHTLRWQLAARARHGGARGTGATERNESPHRNADV